MTSHRLPPDLDGPFSVHDARALGVSRERLRGADLRSGFHGTRSPSGSPLTLVAACAELQTVLDDRHAFTGTTAALIWGMPLPLRLARATQLHVASAWPTRPIRHRRTIANQRPRSWNVTEHLGIRLHAPAETWGSLARTLSVPDLVAVADFIVTPTSVPALDDIEGLRGFLDRARGIAGADRLRASLPRVQVGARSRPETLLRLLLEDAGLPPALINAEYRLSNGRKVIPDLSWPHHRVAVEYDGSYHLEPKQFASDIARTDEMIDDGWLVVHVVAAQLFDRPHEVVARVARRLASRGEPRKPMTHIARFDR